MVGVTNRGKSMTDLLQADSEHFEIVALVDKTEEFARCEAQRRGWNDMKCFGSIKDCLRQVKAEAAIITSPARFHGEQIRDCFEAGLHVLVAKPLVYDLREAEQLVELAEMKNLSLVVDQQYQFFLTERTVSEWIKNKKYGDVGFIDFKIHRHRPNMAAFTGDNPFIWEQGVHSFNSLLSILGRPAVSVFAHQIKPKWSSYNGPTVCFGEIEFSGGIPCQYLGTFDSRAFTIDMRIECEHAAIRTVANKSFLKELEVALPGQTFESVGIKDTDDSQPAERFNLQAFYKKIHEGGRCINDGRDNLRTLAIVDAFIRSSQSRKWESVRQF